MLRSLRLLAVSAVLFAAACSDQDDDLVSRLVANGVQLTTAEDTPAAGNIPVTGNKGRVRASVTSGPSHGQLVLSGTSFTYTPAKDYTGEDTISVSVSDDEKTVAGAVIITITPVNDPPTIATQQLTVAEDTSIMLDAGALGVTDVDSAGPFTVTVANNGSYVVSGNSVTPLPNFNGTLSVNVTVSDGEASAQTAVTLVVTPVNDAPVVVVPAPQNAPNAEPFTVTGVTVSDIDAGTSPVAVTLSANVDAVVSLADTADLTFTEGDGTTDSTVTFSGTLTAVNAALASVTIATPTPNVAVTVTVTANDLGSTGAGGELTDTDELVVGFGSANLPPFNTVPSALTTDEDVPLAINGVSVADADAAGGATVAIALTVTQGSLTLNGTSGLTGVTGNSSAAVAFTGTFANVNAAMSGMTYTPAANYAGADTLTISSTSGGLNDTDVVGITINAVNDAPTITGPTISLEVAAGATFAFTGANLISIADIDAGASAVTVTVTSAEGTFAASGSTVDASTPGTVIFTGAVAAVNTDLATATWNAGAATGNGKTINFVVSDQGATGSGGAKTASLTVTINIGNSVGALNDTYKAQGNVRRTIASPGVLANDAGAGRTVVSTSPITTALGGTVVIAADGSFTYDPPRGLGAREQDGGLDDTFVYEMTAGGTNDSATVTINLRRVIWWVDSATTVTPEDGTFRAPYNTIEEAVAAANGSHFGTWIYVYNRGTQYTTEVELPDGITFIGTRYPFEMQDADPTDSYPPTELPALGFVRIRPTNTTAIRVNEQTRITGIEFTPNASTTGPAILGLANNSGIIDNCIFDGFATAVTLNDTSANFFAFDQVDIANASTAAISVVTGNATGLIVTGSDFTNVGNGLVIDANVGGDDHGRLSLTMAGCNFHDVAQHGIRIDSAAGPDATEESIIRLSNLVITNSPADGVGTGTALSVNAEAGAQLVELTNIFIAGYRSGLTLNVDAAQVIAGFNNVELNGIGPSGSYADGGIRIASAGAATGSLDLTANAIRGSTGTTVGMAVAPTTVDTCMDLTVSGITTTSGTDGLRLTQSGPFALTGYTSGPVATYFSTTPVRFNGSVTATGTFTGGTCATSF